MRQISLSKTLDFFYLGNEFDIHVFPNLVTNHGFFDVIGRRSVKRPFGDSEGPVDAQFLFKLNCMGQHDFYEGKF